MRLLPLLEDLIFSLLPLNQISSGRNPVIAGLKCHNRAGEWIFVIIFVLELLRHGFLVVNGIVRSILELDLAHN